MTFQNPQLAGDLNLVVVGWNDSTATVPAGGVTDSKGNPYTLAVGPTLLAGNLTQAIYYAKNISGAAAGANSVTVHFSPAAAFPDIRIVEYNGADPNNPIDAGSGASGNGTNSSVNLTTTVSNDLIVAANIVSTLTSGPGSGFTTLLMTRPDGDIVEDAPASNPGTYTASAPLSTSGNWIMQAVAVKPVQNTGAPPTATVKPLSLSFGNIVTGLTSSGKTVTLTNSSASSTLTIASIVASGSFQTSTCGSTLAPTSSCTITVKFAPSLPGVISGALSIYDNAPDSPQIVALAGTGLAPVSVTPLNLSFGTVAVGTTSGALTATVKNNSSSGTSLSYGASSDFAATAGASNGCGSSLAGNSSCTIAVTFKPAQKGTTVGSLAVSAGSFPTQTVNLGGSGSGGASPTLSLSPTSWAFGNQVTGVSSAPKTVTVTNTNKGSAVSLNSLTASTDYSVTPSGASPCGSSLPAGGKCTFSVTFTPGSTGTIKGSVVIANTGAVTPLVYNLSGTGVQPVTVSPKSLTFSGQTVGTTSTAQTLTLANAQSVTLSITSAVASGDFAVAPGGTTPCGSTVGANSSCTFVVTFTPSKTGTIKGAVTIIHNASDSPENITLTGTGQ